MTKNEEIVFNIIINFCKENSDNLNHFNRLYEDSKSKINLIKEEDSIFNSLDNEIKREISEIREIMQLLSNELSISFDQNLMKKISDNTGRDMGEILRNLLKR